MRIVTGPARHPPALAALALAVLATLGAGAALGGGSWLVAMLLGALLGTGATLTAVKLGGVGPATARKTLIDPVTGLPNPEKLLADLAGGEDRSLTLYLFTLDGFKDYNDAYGDACGDALLGWLARKMRDAVGDYGNAYRMRGGGFALLVGGTERFTSGLCASAARALTELGDGFQISCDVGKVSVPGEAASPQAALELAARRAHKRSTERHVRSGRRAPSDPDEARRLVRPRDEVAALAIRLARRLDVAPADMETLETAVRLCDVGNLAVPQAVLGYSGRLLGHEWQFILLHTLVGERLLAGSLGMEAVARLVRSSHERWDGSGYPDALAGEAIPLGSRIVFVCSAFHDMTSDRPHHAALEPVDALAQLELGAGSQFDPAVVRAFREEFADALELASRESAPV